MGKQVKGFLASDNKFFDTEAECTRYENMLELEHKCELLGVNYDYFMSTINSLHHYIKGYYDADKKCKEHFVGREVKFDTGQGDGIDGTPSTLPPVEDDNPDYTVGDKDAPGFLKQQVRGDF